MLVLLFSSNIPLNIEKNSVEKLCEVLEMELKMDIPVGLKFKAFHYILHDFIRNAQGLVKIRQACSKGFERVFGLSGPRSPAPIKFSLP